MMRLDKTAGTGGDPRGARTFMKRGRCHGATGRACMFGGGSGSLR